VGRVISVLHSLPNSGAQGLVDRVRIVNGKNADEQVVRRRSLTAIVSKCTACDMITPDMREQKCARKGAANATSVVSEVKLP